MTADLEVPYRSESDVVSASRRFVPAYRSRNPASPRRVVLVGEDSRSPPFSPVETFGEDPERFYRTTGSAEQAGFPEAEVVVLLRIVVAGALNHPEGLFVLLPAVEAEDLSSHLTETHRDKRTRHSCAQMLYGAAALRPS